MLCLDFQEGGGDIGILESLADQIAPRTGDMVILLSKDHDDFAVDLGDASQTVGLFALAQRLTVNICRKVADARQDSRVEGSLHIRNHKKIIQDGSQACE